MALKPFETLSRNYRNLQRTQENINVFLKHGFDNGWSRVKTDVMTSWTISFVFSCSPWLTTLAIFSGGWRCPSQ